MGARIVTLSDNGELRLAEDSANGTDYVGHKAAANVTAQYDVTWPGAPPGSELFMKMDATGVISFNAGASDTLDAAYDSGGAGAGGKITADSGEVEIEVTAASGNVALLLDQDDDQHALSITKDGTGAGSGINLVNAGTGVGLLVDQDGAGIGVDIDQDGSAIALRVNQASANAAIDVTQQAAAAAINVTGGAASAITVGQANDNRCATITKTGVGAGEAVFIENDGTGDGLRVQQDGAGIGLRVDQNANATALQIDQTGTGRGILINQVGASDGIKIVQSTTGNGILLDQDGNGIALSIDSEATSQPLIVLAPAAANTRGTISISGAATDPSGVGVGDIWWNSTDGDLRIRDQNSITHVLGTNTFIAVADPGDGNTITPPGNANFRCEFTNSTGSETRVLGSPAFVGQRGILYALFAGGGTDTSIDEPSGQGWRDGGTADDTVTFDTSGEAMEIIAISATEWRESASWNLAFS